MKEAMNDRNTLIPRKIWILWYQGLSEAPFVVRKCIESWIRENPTWEIILLDKDNIDNYIVFDLPAEKLATLTLTKQSDLIRLQLLSKYGGVWVDSTTLCMKPLDDWINDCVTSGFFAFHKPGPDRLMSTWFIASTEKCHILLKWREHYSSFFMENDFNINTMSNKIIVMLLKPILSWNYKTTRYWFSPIVIKLLRVYPYFILHYIFERLVSSDSEFRTIWSNTKKISADGPHRIRRLGLLSPINEKIKNEIDNKYMPIYKLSYRYDHSKYTPSSILYYLLEGRHHINKDI